MPLEALITHLLSLLLLTLTHFCDLVVVYGMLVLGNVRQLNHILSERLRQAVLHLAINRAHL